MKNLLTKTATCKTIQPADRLIHFADSQHGKFAVPFAPMEAQLGSHGQTALGHSKGPVPLTPMGAMKDQSPTEMGGSGDMLGGVCSAALG